MNRSEAGKLGYAKVKNALLKHVEASKRNARKKYRERVKKCKMCKEPLPYKLRQNIFCSHSCSAKHSNEKRAKKSACITCGVDVLKSWRIKHCNECIKKGYHLRFATSTELCKTDQTRRNILLRAGPRRCSQCHRKTWNKTPIPLQLHHIDGHPENNNMENLCLLCPNCHAQTDSFAGKNVGNGRKNRKG